MKTRLVPLCGKTHRIGNRLIQSDNAELSGSAAIGLARQRDRIADAQRFRSSELPRDEDCRELLALRCDILRRQPRTSHEYEQDNWTNQRLLLPPFGIT